MPVFIIPFDPSVYQFLVCEIKKEEKPDEVFNICLSLWKKNRNPVIGEEIIKLAYKIGNKKLLKELAEFYKERNKKLYNLASFYLAVLENNGEKAYKFGKELIKEGYFDKFLVSYMFKKLLIKEDWESLLLLAEYIYKQNPENNNIKNLLKTIYIALLEKYKSYPEKADRLLKAALKIFSNDKSFLKVALDYYLSLNKEKEARKLAQKLGWGETEYQLERLKVLFSIGKFKEFENLLWELVNKYPNDAHILNYAVRYYTLKGNSEKLISIMEKYLKLHPQLQDLNPKTLLIYFLSKIWDGNLNENDKSFLEKYIKTFGNNKAQLEEYITANLLKANLYIKKGEYKKALEILKNLRTIAGKQLDRFILYPAYKIGVKESYEGTLKKMEPEEVLIVANFFKNRDKDFVVNLLKDYARLRNNIEGYEFSIWTLDRLNFWNDAEELLKEAIKKFPNHAEFYNYLGYSYVLYFGKQKVDEALKLLQEAHELKPNDAPILDSLGWAYFVKGDLKKAKQYLEEALKRMPDDPVINEHYGVLLLIMAKQKGINPCKDKNNPLVKQAKEHLLKAYRLAEKKETEPEKGFFKRIKRELKEICVNPE
jgi:tetratricopeptide (TPR) repeat protein